MGKDIMSNRYMKIILGLAIIAAGLTYLGWGLDLIPDTLMWVGYIDDAAVVLLGGWLLFRMYAKKKSKK